MRENEKRNACVYLVGAGCGTKEWITLEGLQLLRDCDAVVYDDLIDPALLAEVPAAAEKIYMGKRMNCESARQEDIQDVLVRLAGEKQRIVRLKGGDPFVFGRGGEEILHLNAHGIRWHVVPGISSSLAIPAQAGIPVTHRGISRSIHIMTAHTKEDRLRQDLDQFAKLEGTLVFLMGLNSLPTIVERLCENGRDAQTPAAVLSGGNSRNRRRVVGTLETIVEKTAAANVVSPAVIVVGEVAALNLLEQTGESVTVGLTGTDEFQEKLRKELGRRGIDSVSLMTGESCRLEVRIPWEDLRAPQEKWIVFTSIKGVQFFFRECAAVRFDHRAFAACKFAVIGGETRRELEAYGFTADLCPEEYHSKALAAAMCQAVSGDAVVHLFCSKQGTGNLEEALADRGVACKRYDVYDTVFSCTGDPKAPLDYVLFGSAAGVRSLQASGFALNGAKPVCIGPICADTFRSVYGAEPLMAPQATVAAMAELVAQDIGNKEEVEE